MTVKECTNCNTVKPLAEFSKNKRASLGYGYECKVCSRHRARVNRQGFCSARVPDLAKLRKELVELNKNSSTSLLLRLF